MNWTRLTLWTYHTLAVHIHDRKPSAYEMLDRLGTDGGVRTLLATVPWDAISRYGPAAVV